MACRSWSAPAIIWTRVRRSHNSRMGSEASGNQRLLQGQRWVSGDIRLPRASQEELTRKARAIIADKDKASHLSSRETRGGAHATHQ